MMRPVFVAAFALLLAACGKQESATETTPVAAPAGSEKPAPVTPTVEGRFAGEIKAEDFAARLKKLSSDQFEGREPGTIGERVTTNYIKDQFERIGLKPGNNGNWFQTVPMVKTELIDPASVRIEVTGSTGTPFVAPADGVVVLAAQTPFSLEGYLLMIDHGNGLNSAFLHCSKIVVKEGDVVKQGQHIGNIGSSGRATGPHLHWGLKWRDARLDPLLFVGPMN